MISASTTSVSNVASAAAASKALPLAIRKRGVTIGSVFDEDWIEGEAVPDPKTALAELASRPEKIDIFTFYRALPETNVLFPYKIEWENVAVAKTDDFERWWMSLPQESRKNVRRSERRGVTVSQIQFDDEIARGLSVIYNETPIRQGRRFPHYGKSVAEVKSANSSYLERGECIGAFHEGQLIGFLKFVMVNKVARIMQIIALDAHSDKRPTNALLAKAMSVACARGASHMVYGRYIYGNKKNSPVTEFKRRNGFEQLNYPRYFVPVTLKGSIAMKLQMHRELSSILPEPVINAFLKARAALWRRAGNQEDGSLKPMNREA